ncbi:MAG TPA: PA0069 family radical SAM protein [Steroidobacteraceae bacterium]|nr:PA0069 family radical SAM protein [Steroidobacteraceae bacterium]
MSNALKGRGALSNPPGRFDTLTKSLEHDGWFEEEPPEHVATTVLPEPARSIISRNDSPDIGFGQSINPYRGCAHACIYCLSGDTAVLMADGSHKPIEQLKVGDAIYGTERSDWQRRYVKTRVLAHWQVTRQAYRITLSGGVVLVAGAEHRLLTDRGWKFVADPAAQSPHRATLVAGDRLMGTNERDLEGKIVGSEPGFAVTGIEPVNGPQRLFDITTGTEDFIANGVISHNCYARPSHAYLGLSPGLDFETKLFYKADAAKLLESELGAKNYKCSTLMLGANTDPYQPIEKTQRVTRSILEVLARHRHPVSITTKGALVARDVDLLADLAKDGLARVMFSIPTLNNELKRILEPRAASATAKLKAMRVLADAGVIVGVNVAPIIPVLTEHEIEAVLEASRESGATHASYTILRLPYEVKDLFREWLAEHFPDRAAHVMSIVRAMRGERDNDPDFGTRMHATGPVAQLIRQRFQLATRRLGFSDDRRYELPTHLFRPPRRSTPQLSLDL